LVCNFLLELGPWLKETQQEMAQKPQEVHGNTTIAAGRFWQTRSSRVPELVLCWFTACHRGTAPAAAIANLKFALLFVCVKSCICELKNYFQLLMCMQSVSLTRGSD